MSTTTRRPRKPPKVVRPKRPKLTAKQRAADANALYDPVQQLAGHRLSEAADAIVNAQYGPKLAALGREARSTEAQDTALMGRAGDYYRQLAQQEAEGVARQQALSNRASGALAKVASDSQSVLDRLAASHTQSQAEDVQTRGAGLSGGGNEAVLNELAAARARLADSAQAFRSSGELQNSAQEQLAANMLQARQQHGAELQGQLANRLANQEGEIRAQRSDLEAQRGDERVKQLLGLRQQGYENLVTQRGLGIKQSQLAADIANQQDATGLAIQRLADARAHNRATERTQRSGSRQQKQSLAERERHNQALEELARQRAQHQASGKDGKRAKEPQSAVKVKRTISNIVDAIHNGHSDRYLLQKGALNDELQAAHDLDKYGYLLPDTVKRLRNIGMHIPSEWRPPKQPPASSFGPH